MKEYLKMSDVFIGPYKLKARIDAIPAYRHGEKLAELYGVHAEYAAHAINSHDELVEINKELLYALESLIDDMRLRAKLDGDVDSDGTVILNCGNGVLFAATKAMDKAKR